MATQTITNRLLTLDSSALLQKYVRSLGPHRTTQSAPTADVDVEVENTTCTLGAMLNDLTTTTRLPIRRQAQTTRLPGMDAYNATEQGCEQRELPPIFRAALERCASIALLSSASYSSSNALFTVTRKIEATGLDNVYEVIGRYADLQEANVRVVSLVLKGSVWRVSEGRDWDVKVLEGGMMDVGRRVEGGWVRVWVGVGDEV
jgi:hypothetical protein